VAGGDLSSGSPSNLPLAMDSSLCSMFLHHLRFENASGVFI
jgi:hypothetical protein